jgi:hypothetical protein
VGPVVGVPLTPGTAEVFDLDPGSARGCWQRTVKVQLLDWVWREWLTARSRAVIAMVRTTVLPIRNHGQTVNPPSAGGGLLTPSSAASATQIRERSSGSNGDRWASWRSRSSPAQATSGQLMIVCAAAGSARASRTKLLPTSRRPNSAAQA